MEYENEKELEKALNEEIYLLKKIKIDNLAAKAQTAEEVQRIVELKRNLSRLSIALGE